MDEQPDSPTDPGHARHVPNPLPMLWRTLKDVVVRSYALLILLVVLWAGVAAVNYLVHQVFYPSPVSQDFLRWQGRLEADALRTEHAPGVTEGSTRAPIGHFHTVRRWFQPDPTNGCTPSGCHSPLPHQQQKTLRAFANFHTTFLDCGTCHGEAADRTAPATWIDTATGQPAPAPAMLELIGYLSAHPAPASQPHQTHDKVVGLLRRVVKLIPAGPDDGILNYTLLELETSEPGSPVWRRAMKVLADELPRHARGEYGAKIAFVRSGQGESMGRPGELGQPDQPRQPIRPDPGLRQLTDAYLASPPGSEKRKDLRRQIHADLATPAGCMACHSSQAPGLPGLDLTRLGYSADRARQLRMLALARMAEQIHHGQPFYLPRIMGDSHEP